MILEVLGGGGAWDLILALLIMGYILFRNARTRRVRMERLWVNPALVLLLTGASIARSPPQSLNAIGLETLALILGAVLGWWRGRASRLIVDPQTHEVTRSVSIGGMLLILGIFVLRYVLRIVLGDQTAALHVRAVDIADTLLVLLVGVVCAHRTEWFIRARRMIAQAKAAA